MEKLPLSVIIPVYNAAPYLRFCLDSILGQTIPAEVIICVDDGSTDESLDILQEYASIWESVHIVRKKNGGQTSARKAGLAAVRTLYTAFVDADDWIEPQMYEELVAEAVGHNADIVSSGYFLDHEHRQDIIVNAVAPGVYEGVALHKLKQAIFPVDELGDWRYDLLLWNKVFRTDFIRPFQKEVDERIRVGEDNAVVWPALLHAGCVVETGRAYYHYCWRPGSVMNDEEMQEGRVSFTALREYLATKIRPLCHHIPNIMDQLLVFDTQSVYSAGRWNECETLFGDVLRPFGNIPREAKIALYGAGGFGRKLKVYLDAHGYNVVAWVDQVQNCDDVRRPSMLLRTSYDILLIGVLKNDAVHGILLRLDALCVPAEKIRRITMEGIREAAYE